MRIKSIQVWEGYGIMRTEVALMEIDKINDDDSILPNIKLGIEV